MTYYPVCIPTLCRYEHFKRCVESLRSCSHAKETELIVSVDYPTSENHKKGRELILNYLDKLTGFRKVTVIVLPNNIGAVKNWMFVKSLAFKNYGAAILSEDDNEFSPCFLDFMNKALTYYADDLNVSSVSGYNQAFFYDKVSEDCMFFYRNSSWGVGLWKAKEELFDRLSDNSSRYIYNYLRDYKRSKSLSHNHPSVFYMILEMSLKKQVWEDVIRAFYNINEGKYQLRPTVSLVRNWGQDGSGLHSGINPIITKQAISTSSYFVFNGDPLSADSLICNLFYKSTSVPISFIGKKRYCVKLWFMYLKYRIIYKSF